MKDSFDKIEKETSKLVREKTEPVAQKTKQIMNIKRTILVRTDRDIHDAVKEWCAAPENAKSKSGDISEWDTSAVTSMEKLF